MNSKNTLACIGLAFGLSSCVAIDTGSNGAQASDGAQSAQRGMTNQQSTVETMLEVSSAQSAQDEQAQLIEQINRNGRANTSASYNENVPAAVTPPVDTVLELNYEQADLRIVLEELSDALDISIIIDPSIDDKVSLRTSPNRPLSQADIWPLIRLLSRQAGVSVERVGNVYYARKQESSLPTQISTQGQAGAGTSAFVMQITPVTYISLSSAQEILTPLVGGDGVIVKLNNTTLAISASASQLNRINELLTVIDADPFSNQGLQLYSLRNANAADIATELEEVLALIEGPSPAYQVKGLERINALLVTAPANRGFEEISRWVKLLDAGQQEQAEQLFHYRVKNLTATELATTLTNVFALDDEDSVPPRDEDSQQEQTRTVSVINPEGETITRTVTPSSSNSVAVSADLRVTIVADEATNSLLIRANPRDYRQLLATINQLDSVPLQVMINAVIAQVTLNDETRFGVDWSRIADNATVNSTSTETSTSFTPGGDLGGLLFTKSFLDGASRVEATLNAIATNNEVRLLARPSLTVINNMEGEIQIGSEVPVQSGSQTTGNGDNIISNIQYRPTGIELYITPRINNDGVVNMTIRQVLSSIEDGTGVEGNPIFQNQEISTTVVVRDGENVVLGGLIQSSDGDLNTGVPYLNRVPVLGNLFSYQQDVVERKELFIVLRPEIVNLNDFNGAQYNEILQRFELASQLLEDAQ
ncbi:MAG: type II secretion system secretin GspD [Pseudohongiellaceae bacterium]|nr:type II secretion system secretin GspD [Pseudohongiellaceae bacterium]